MRDNSEAGVRDEEIRRDMSAQASTSGAKHREYRVTVVFAATKRRQFHCTVASRAYTCPLDQTKQLRRN